MTRHPPLLEQELARKPRVERFTFDAVTVRCPKCRAVKIYRLAVERPRDDDYCPSCLTPWRWA